MFRTTTIIGVRATSNFNERNILKKIFLSLIFLFSLSNCAPTKSNMALNGEDKIVDLTKDSIGLISVKSSSQAMGCSFYLWSFFCKSENENEAKKIPLDSPENGEYLVSFKIPPGKYNMKAIMGGVTTMSKNYMVSAITVAPFEIKQNEIRYLGHIDFVVKDRDIKFTDALKSSVTGFFKGEVLLPVLIEATINDNYENDIKLFRAKYPLLNNYSIEKQVMPFQLLTPTSK